MTPEWSLEPIKSISQNEIRQVLMCKNMNAYICKRNMYISVVQDLQMNFCLWQPKLIKTFDPDLYLSFFICKIEITFPLSQWSEEEGSN